MASKQKFYVVWHGHKPGIYTDWGTAKKQIENFKGAKYKSYKTKAEAESAFKDIGPQLDIRQKRSAVNTANSICVDAACAGNPGVMEYRGVVTDTGRELFRVGPFPVGTNNIGEFLGIVHALAYLDQQGRHDVTIFTDSATAMAWIRNKKIKTTLERYEATEVLFKLVDKAIIWLHQNAIKNPIKKWPTDLWGEIPADFGRK
jgi:ribonuclease HI